MIFLVMSWYICIYYLSIYGYKLDFRAYFALEIDDTIKFYKTNKLHILRTTADPWVGLNSQYKKVTLWNKINLLGF